MSLQGMGLGMPLKRMPSRVTLLPGAASFMRRRSPPSYRLTGST